LVTVALRPVAVAVDPPAGPPGDQRSNVGVDGGASGNVDHGPAAACATTVADAASGGCDDDALGAVSACATGVDVINACTGRSGSVRGARSRIRLRRPRVLACVGAPFVINAI
jgi:hypothetical protein